MENIAKSVKTKRRRLGLSQVEFSERTGIGLATIRDVEQGKTTVKLSSLLAIIDALGLELKLKDKNNENR